MQSFYAEHSRLRYWLLKIYAWKEVQLLHLLFLISRLPILKYAVFRKALYYPLLHFLGTRGAACQAATLDEVMRFIDDLDDDKIAVGPCRCRVGNRNCNHDIMTDIVIKQTAKIWYHDLFPKDYRLITKTEAKEICRRSRAAGMIQCIDRHMYFDQSKNYFVICNCCKESCIPLIAYRLFKQELYAFLPSTYVVRVDGTKCRACGRCIDICPFGERELVEANGFTTVLSCQGCGLCVDVCEAGANRMVLRGAAAAE